MFKGKLSQVPSGLSRSERRLAVLARASSSNGRPTSEVQRHTRLNAQREMKRRQDQRELRRSGHRRQREFDRNADMQAAMGVVQRAQEEALREEDARRSGVFARNGGTDYSGSHHETKMWREAAASQRYDDVDSASGDSVIQQRFNELVHTALLRFGPPLPPEFVADNDVVTSSASASPRPADHAETDAFMRDARTGRTAHMSWRADLGADGRSFYMYDEVGIKTHELLSIIRRLQPTFSIKDDCDGVPFSLLIRNCPYLRAFGGKVNYMRYLRREQLQANGPSRVVVSIAKYKMREAAAQDGVRQGPQPWKYSYGMV